MREAERRVMANEVSILNSRVLEREILKLNYTHKTLDALAGVDDKIFVILDDRDDVWLKEGYLPSENLLKIPAYFYHDDK